MSVRSVLSKAFSAKPESTVKRAERAFADGRFAEAATMFRELADAGNVDGQLRLAQLYEHGQGVLQSFVEAVRWFRAAAEQGSVPAQARLGEIYLTGLEAPATATASAVARIDAPGTQGSLLNRLFPQRSVGSSGPCAGGALEHVPRTSPGCGCASTLGLPIRHGVWRCPRSRSRRAVVFGRGGPESRCRPTRVGDAAFRKLRRIERQCPGDRVVREGGGSE